MQQPIVQYQELMNATIDTALQRPTWGRKLSPYGQPGAENYRHSFLPQVGRGTSSIYRRPLQSSWQIFPEISMASPEMPGRDLQAQ